MSGVVHTIMQLEPQFVNELIAPGFFVQAIRTALSMVPSDVFDFHLIDQQGPKSLPQMLKTIFRAFAAFFLVNQSGQSLLHQTLLSLVLQSDSEHRTPRSL